MKQPHLPAALILPVLLLLPGCLVTQSGNLEVLNPKQAYGRSLAVVGNLHRENEAIEQRLASDLGTALTKRGLTVAEDPSKADLVVVPTLGRMRERSPAVTAVPVEGAISEPVEAAEPVVAAPAPEARPFNRFSGANMITRTDLVSRRAVPSARVPANAQQAGLLLTAYRSEDFLDYGMGRQSLPPVWRIYVSQPATQMKWNSVAVPLINAAAGAAKPLGKSKELGAGSAPTGDRTQATGTEGEAVDRSPRRPNRNQQIGDKPSLREDKKKDLSTDATEDEEPEKKRKLFPWFGGSADREKNQEAEQPEAGN